MDHERQPEETVTDHSGLLCADLTPLAARTVPTPAGYLSICTFKEWTGRALEFWAGAALRPDAETALADAADDALLSPWGGSVLKAGAARLVANGTCRAARITQPDGVTTIGSVADFPPVGGLGVEAEAGARLAIRTPAGDFRALSLGSATVMLQVAPGWGGARRVEEWFDTLEAARDAAALPGTA